MSRYKDGYVACGCQVPTAPGGGTGGLTLHSSPNEGLSSLQISEILAPIAVRKWRRRCDDEGHQAGLQTGFL